MTHTFTKKCAITRQLFKRYNPEYTFYTFSAISMATIFLLIINKAQIDWKFLSLILLLNSKLILRCERIKEKMHADCLKFFKE